MSFKLGICTQPERVAEIATYYDYVELTVSQLLPLADEAAWAPRLAELRALALPVRAYNSFVPREVSLVGEQVDWGLVERFVSTAIARAASLGGRVIVFGSGPARHVPEGFSRDRAWAQLARFLHLCADHAERHDLTIAIEPLNRGESNILNSYAEGARMAREVNRPRVRALADIYHMMEESEPLDNLLAAPEWLAHVHLADSGRLHPGTGQYPLARLFEVLRQIGYGGAASVECRWGEDFAAQARAAATFLRPLMA